MPDDFERRCSRARLLELMADMSRRNVGARILLAGLALLSACKRDSRSETPVGEISPSAQVPAKEWLGVWRGPEGTSLELSESDGRYRITIRNLDGPRTFDATASDSSVTFVRDGVQETVRAGSGADTGMKWLADNTDCLVVKSGEGYCRE